MSYGCKDCSKRMIGADNRWRCRVGGQVAEMEKDVETTCKKNFRHVSTERPIKITSWYRRAGRKTDGE